MEKMETEEKKSEGEAGAKPRSGGRKGAVLRSGENKEVDPLTEGKTEADLQIEESLKIELQNAGKNVLDPPNAALIPGTLTVEQQDLRWENEKEAESETSEETTEIREIIEKEGTVKNAEETIEVTNIQKTSVKEEETTEMAENEEIIE